MRRLAVVALAATLLAPVAHGSTANTDFQGDLGPADPPVTQPRGSIVIEGDGDLEEPTAISGVRSGSGTAEDPYVISRWTIQPTHRAGILLQDTRAHVVVESVRVSGPTGTAFALADCAASIVGLEECRGDRGIELRNVTNVTVREVRIDRVRTGLTVEASQAVSVDQARVGDPLGEGRSQVSTVLHVENSHDVRFRNVAGSAVDRPLLVEPPRSTSLALVDSTIRGEPGFDPTHTLEATSGLRIVRTQLETADLQLTGPNEDLAILESRLTESPIATADDVSGTSLRLCGTTITGAGTDAVRLSGIDEARIEANRLNDNADGIDVEAVGSVEVERNVFTDTAGPLDAALVAHAAPALVHDNHFAHDQNPSVRGGAVVDGPDSEATHNWWNATDGPNLVEDDDAAGGSGDPFATDTSVPYRPFLEAPPDAGPGSVDCGVDGSTVGAQTVPSLR